MKMLTNISIQKQMEMMGKSGFKIEKKLKNLAITMTNLKFMLYQNYVTRWSKLKEDILRWEKLSLE